MPLCCGDLACIKLIFEHIDRRGKLRQKFSTHFMFNFKAKNSNNQKWAQTFFMANRVVIPIKMFHFLH